LHEPISVRLEVRITHRSKRIPACDASGGDPDRGERLLAIAMEVVLAAALELAALELAFGHGPAAAAAAPRWPRWRSRWCSPPARLIVIAAGPHHEDASPRVKR